MSTSQNDGETIPRPDAKKGPDVKETSDAKETSKNQRKSPEEQLKELKEKKTQLAHRIDRLLMAARARDRKRQTRRKIIIGGVMLLEADKNEKTHLWLRARIDEYVKKDSDRELFADLLTTK